MKLGLRQIIALISALLLAVILPAQNLPKMPADPALMTGVLPNGLSYFIVSNAYAKGVADFALIQKTGACNVPDSLAGEDCARRTARQALASVPRLKDISPQDFFLRHGALPGKAGYVSVSEDATVFRFPGVRLSDHNAVLDSALVVLLNIADRGNFSDNSFLRKWYPLADQAIVISGDVDAKTLLSRLEAMAYMIPFSSSAERMDVYLPDTSRVRIAGIGQTGALREISMTWVSKRVPREYMNTVQPVIFDRSMDMLGKVSVKRLRETLETERIPVADVSYLQRNADEGPGDDAFTLRVTVDSAYVSVAQKLMSGVISSIDADGVTVDEYLLAEADFMNQLRRESLIPYCSNSAYVERCISSFRYNSLLSSPKQIHAFHTAREIPDSVRTRLFNDVAAAMIHPFETECPVDPVPAPASLSFPMPGPKVKIKSVKKDHLSGGSVWTFSNGFRVVYRNMPSAGEVYYTLALNGGYGSMPGLSGGEGAFMSDIFRLIRVGGMKGTDFFNALKKEGLVMNPRITLSNTLIEGHLPKDRMPVLLQTLQLLSTARSSMEESFQYYRETEKLALEHPGNSYAMRMTAIDSIMCPGYRFSPYKTKGKLSSAFYSKAYAFLDAQMEKLNDGVLVIVGDIDEEYLKQQLMSYVGNFPVKDAPAKRPSVRYQPVSGWSTYTVRGESNAVDVALSARMPLTLNNYLAACIAVMTIEHDLTEALAESGMSFEVQFNCRIYPEERINMLVSVSEVDTEGLALGYTRKSAIDVLSDVREALSELDSKEISDDELKQYKAYLKNLMSAEMKDPQYWVDAIVVRYLDGKDLTTGYAANIDALSRDDIRKVLALIDRGCKVEYVTEK
ncbi:MAG: insulinase family protein [Bacteroidales bacterium]|nr:insulinase family protein [Bacteroidales bacterium]